MKQQNPDFIEIINKYDIVFSNECWTSKKDVFDMNDFTCFSKHRKKSKNAKRNSGGLFLLIRNHLIEYLEELEWNFEDGFIFKSRNALAQSEKYLYLLFLYMRPVNSSRTEIANDNDVYTVLKYLKSEI